MQAGIRLLRIAFVLPPLSLPKNILILMVDQQRPDALGCYGSRIAMTPHIDRLAREGVRFESRYVQNPLCCPSRFSMLTGRYPHSHGARSSWYAPRPSETSFGHQLARAGCQSALIGKMHFTPWHDLFGFGGRRALDWPAPAAAVETIAAAEAAATRNSRRFICPYHSMSSPQMQSAHDTACACRPRVFLLCVPRVCPRFDSGWPSPCRSVFIPG